MLNRTNYNSKSMDSSNTTTYDYLVRDNKKKKQKKGHVQLTVSGNKKLILVKVVEAEQFQNTNSYDN